MQLEFKRYSRIRERERGREEKQLYIYVYIYIYIHPLKESFVLGSLGASGVKGVGFRGCSHMPAEKAHAAVRDSGIGRMFGDRARETGHAWLPKLRSLRGSLT